MENGLNPCFSGRYAGRIEYISFYTKLSIVLILVFREDMLGAIITEPIDY